MNEAKTAGGRIGRATTGLSVAAWFARLVVVTVLVMAGVLLLLDVGHAGEQGARRVVLAALASMAAGISLAAVAASTIGRRIDRERGESSARESEIGVLRARLSASESQRGELARRVDELSAACAQVSRAMEALGDARPATVTRASETPDAVESSRPLASACASLAAEVAALAQASADAQARIAVASDAIGDALATCASADDGLGAHLLDHAAAATALDDVSGLADDLDAIALELSRRQDEPALGTLSGRSRDAAEVASRSASDLSRRLDELRGRGADRLVELRSFREAATAARAAALDAASRGRESVDAVRRVEDLVDVLSDAVARVGDELATLAASRSEASDADPRTAASRASALADLRRAAAEIDALAKSLPRA